MVASNLPCCQPAAHTASSNAGTITDSHPSDRSAGANNNNDHRSGPMSLLEKYTFRETVRTVIEEDDLPELPDFLESINLGGRLEVSSRNILLTHVGSASFRSCMIQKEKARGLNIRTTDQARRVGPTLRHGSGVVYVHALGVATWAWSGHTRNTALFGECEVSCGPCAIKNTLSQLS